MRSRVGGIAVVATAAIVAISFAAVAAAKSSGGSPFTAGLTGAAEVPGPGDPDGSGTFTMKIKVDKGELCYTLHVFDIGPATAAHVHAGSASVAGGVVVTLAAPAGGSSSGCISGLAKSLLKDIKKNPGHYYANVHNAQYPGGALRGQIEKS